MTQIDLKSLIERLGPMAKVALESAAAATMSRGHHTVELEHWFLQLLENGKSDLAEVLRLRDISPRAVQSELTHALEKFKGGNSRPPSLSPLLVDCAKNAWISASVNHHYSKALSSHLLIAALSDDIAGRQLRDSAPSLKGLSADDADAATRSILGKTEESQSTAYDEDSSDGAPSQPGATAQTGALDKFTVNLTERAKNGEIDAVLGRDTEIRQCIDILMRRRQNNPILTGEAGVGKTAVVEGLALRVATGDVPEPLKGVTIRTLDLGLLQAGASVKGEFENRLRSVIDEVKASPSPIITFIDEAHTLIGAGGQAGQGDAANLLKPALARGELRTIAATTWAEYKKYFERDPALTRRFQVVKIEEPSEEVAIDMMRGLAGMLQSHHKVRIGDDALVASVKLSHRYIPDRQLPDKSVSLLDTACARVALTQLSMPADIEDTQRDISQMETNIRLIERENVSSGEYDEQLENMRTALADRKSTLDMLTDRWSQEQAIINDLNELRSQLEDDYSETDEEAKLSEEDRRAKQAELRGLKDLLVEVQGDQPLMSPQVDANAVADVVANWTGIPVGKMIGDDVNNIMALKEKLKTRVIGQDHALEAIAQVVATSRAGLNDPRKPTGVFMMIGTSGTGKTETALALADILYGGEQNLTVINMSEFKEEHKVSMLLGSPPGYVGFGEGGVLTEAARRKPYSVILLDEMEKAHPGVQDVFYNLFDKGTIRDGEGRDIDFKNTMIIMTTNAGENAIRAIMAQEEEKPEPELLLDSIRPELLKVFKPAFMGRCSLITYYPLEDEQLLEICKINMRKIERRVRERYNASFSYHEDVILHIVARCQEADTGARNLENILSKTLLPQLATECLTHLGSGEDINSIAVGVTEEGAFEYTVA
ncbi:MAG: type VI secretion system protein VasG [Halieaceae bacterium]|jgi:type VI secretion system protein VasG